MIGFVIFHTYMNYEITWHVLSLFSSCSNDESVCRSQSRYMLCPVVLGMIFLMPTRSNWTV